MKVNVKHSLTWHHAAA